MHGESGVDDQSPAHDDVPLAAAQRRAWVRQVTLTAAISFTLAIAGLTAVEAIRGQALASDRDTTFFGGAPSATGPTLDVPAGVSALAGARLKAHVAYAVTAADAAGSPLAPVCDPPSGSLFELGRTRVVCAVTDAAGERAEAAFLVTVRRGGSPPPPDHQRPVLTVPADFPAEATRPAGARVTYSASATDARDGELTPVCRPASGTLFALGPTRVACTATDAAGNTARDRFVVTVRVTVADDATPPVITTHPPGATGATSPDGATVSYEVAVTDNRDGSLKPSCDPSSGSVFAIGKTTVTCSATDQANNKGMKRFTVTVVDEPPVLDLPPDVEVQARGFTRANKLGRTSVPFDTRARDAVDGELVPECKPPSGSLFAIGSSTVTCTVTDSNDTTVTGSFTVTVLRPPDTRPPVIDTQADIAKVTDDPSGITVSFSVGASDDRDGRLSARCYPRSGSLFRVGTTTVTCRATDSAGNRAIPMRFQVVVEYREPVD